MGRKRVIKENNLLRWCERNGEYGQQLIKEWNHERNKNIYGISQKIHDFTHGSSQEVWWKCLKCENEWEMRIHNRTKMGRGCPICRNERLREFVRIRRINEGNSLKNWCEQHGVWGKKLIEEWDYIENAKLNMTPETVTYGTTTSAWWTCNRCGESFEMRIFSRTVRNARCPHCSSSATSYPEQFIFCALKQIQSDVRSRVKLFNNIEYDIVLPTQKVCIEYNGVYWHQNKEIYDEMKYIKCIENGYRYIRVEDIGTEKQIYCTEERIIFPGNDRGNLYEYLKQVVSCISSLLGLESSNIDFVKVDNNVWETLNKVDKSIDKLCPILRDEWADERSIKKCSINSHTKALWRCKECKHEWKSSIYDRIHRKTSCPHCKYNIFYNERYMSGIRYKKSVDITHPELIKEWNDKESIKNYTAGSSYKAAWKCSKCNNIWNVSIHSRSYNKNGCPKCHYNVFRDSKIT